jgi:hypothetical protein
MISFDWHVAVARPVMSTAIARAGRESRVQRFVFFGLKGRAVASEKRITGVSPARGLRPGLETERLSSPLKKCSTAPCGRRSPEFNVTHEE